MIVNTENSEFWISRVHLDTACAGAVADNGHLHVALVSPDGVPGVLHHVVVFSAFVAISYKEYSVVK